MRLIFFLFHIFSIGSTMASEWIYNYITLFYSYNLIHGWLHSIHNTHSWQSTIWDDSDRFKRWGQYKWWCDAIVHYKFYFISFVHIFTSKEKNVNELRFIKRINPTKRGIRCGQETIFNGIIKSFVLLSCARVG